MWGLMFIIATDPSYYLVERSTFEKWFDQLFGSKPAVMVHPSAQIQGGEGCDLRLMRE